MRGEERVPENLWLALNTPLWAVAATLDDRPEKRPWDQEENRMNRAVSSAGVPSTRTVTAFGG